MMLLLIIRVMFKSGLCKRFQRGGLVGNDPIDWPASSTDLTPTDFFLWWHLKETVYKSKTKSLSYLRQSIMSAFRTFDSDLCKKFCDSVPERLQQCNDANGHQFEHFK